MFGRYTERARRVLFFARYEASHYGGTAIETEHLLLGLIREGKGLTSRVFARSHLSLDSLRRDIDAHRLAKQHARVPGTPQDPSDRRGDVTGRQRRGRNLIQQRLKDVMVAAIQQRDLGVGLSKRLRGRESPETAANDHDMRAALSSGHRALSIVP